jgi:hypothetical protein
VKKYGHCAKMALMVRKSGVTSLALAGTGHAADNAPSPQVLFNNVNTFKGTEDKLYENHSVLVEGNLSGRHGTACFAALPQLSEERVGRPGAMRRSRFPTAWLARTRNRCRRSSEE